VVSGSKKIAEKVFVYEDVAKKLRQSFVEISDSRGHDQPTQAKAEDRG
jgi:hypothetical protein